MGSYEKTLFDWFRTASRSIASMRSSLPGTKDRLFLLAASNSKHRTVSSTQRSRPIVAFWQTCGNAPYVRLAPHRRREDAQFRGWQASIVDVKRRCVVVGDRCVHPGDAT